MNLLFVLLFVAASSISLAIVLKVRPATSLATALMSTSLVTYVLGLTNALWMALPVIIGASIVTLFILYFRRRSEIIAASKDFVSSPATTLYLVYAVTTFALSRPMLFSYWDEYSHWGLVVKAMFTFDALSPYSPATLIFPSYPPSAATFEYFISKFSSSWNEANSIWAYQLLLGSLALAFARTISWKNWPRILILGAMFAFASMLFFDSFLGTIIEPLLAATFGYAIAMIWLERDWNSSFYFRLGVALSFLILLKDSGAFLAIICLAFLGFFFKVSGQKFQVRTKQTRALIWVVVAVGLAYTSWNLTLRITNTHLKFSQPISLSNVGQVLTGSGSDFYKEVTSRFNQALITSPLNTIESGAPLSWAVWLTILIPTIVYLATLDSRMRKSMKLLGPGLIALCGALVYQFGLLILYVTRFDKGEALGLASFPRYLSTYIFGLLLFVAFVLTSHIAERGFVVKRQGKTRPAWSFIAVISVFLIGLGYLAPLSAFLNHWPGGASSRAAFREPYASLGLQASRAGLTNDDVVLSIAQHTTGLEHLMTMYQLMPARVLDWPYSIGQRRDESDTLTDSSIDAVSIQSLLRSVDFVALVVIDDQFKEEFASIFSAPEDIQPAKLYKVDCGPATCKLRALASFQGH